MLGDVVHGRAIATKVGRRNKSICIMTVELWAAEKVKDSRAKAGVDHLARVFSETGTGLNCPRTAGNTPRVKELAHMKRSKQGDSQHRQDDYTATRAGLGWAG